MKIRKGLVGGGGEGSWGPAGGADTVVVKLILTFSMVLSWGILVYVPGWGSRSVAAIVLAKPPQMTHPANK